MFFIRRRHAMFLHDAWPTLWFYIDWVFIGQKLLHSKTELFYIKVSILLEDWFYVFKQKIVPALWNPENTSPWLGVDDQYVHR